MEAFSLLVNASILGERPTGLGSYGIQLMAALDEIGERLTVLTSFQAAVTAPHARFINVSPRIRPERGLSGAISRVFWTQTALRAQLRLARPAALLNLTSEGIVSTRLPQVTVVHDVLPLHYPSEFPREQYYFRYYVQPVLAASRRIIVSSESTRRDIRRFFPRISDKHMRVVSPGCDMRRFTPGSTNHSGPPYALYLGNVLPHKNLRRLIEAFAIACVGSEMRLVIKGSGRQSSVDELRELIDRLGIGKRVDWEPYVDASALLDLYRGARVLLLPSLYEGFGMTALEAMACGTPVITSSTSSLPEVVGDAAVLVDPTNTEELAYAIKRIMVDDNLANNLRTRGLSRARQFSWEKTACAVQLAVHEAIG